MDDFASDLARLLLDLRGVLRGMAEAADADNPLKKSLSDQADLIRERLGELGVTLESPTVEKPEPDREGGLT